MKEIFVNNSLNIIKKNKGCDDKEIIKLRYGLEGLFSFITKYSVILIINIILNTFIEFILFHFSYAIIRAFSFGLHAKTNKGCWFVSILMYVLIPLLIKYLTLDKNVLIIVSILASIIISIFAPADTKKRPLINKKKRIQNKILSILVCILYLILMAIFNNTLIYCLGYSLFFQAIIVNPFTYKITNQSFNNYKNMNV